MRELKLDKKEEQEIECLLLKTNGDKEKILPKNPKEGFSLEELYTIIQCKLVEVVRCNNPKYILIVDEEGLLKRDPVFNLNASLLSSNKIVGNAIYCKKKYFK